MKKSVKIIITVVIVLSIAAGGIYYMMMPLSVRMTEVRPQTAELSFMEQGIVSTGRNVLVFPGAQGEINNLYVTEGQFVNAGDALLSVDDTGLRLRLLQLESAIAGLEAQLANVSVEADIMRQNLQTTLNSLQGELRAIDAQAAQSDRAFESHSEILNEQMRLQQIIIDQHVSDYERAQENFTRIQQLYEAGVSPRVDFIAAESALLGAQTQLEAAQGQMAVIAAGAGVNDTEHFEGIRESLNAQIEGINRQLRQDTTTAATAQIEAMIAVERLNMAQIENEIQNAVVNSPVSGVITTLQAQDTNFISMASPIAEITVPNVITIEVFVSTQDVGSVSVGDTVGITLRGRMNDIDFSGRVVEIDNTAVVRHTALGVEERRVEVRIEPDIPAGVELGDGFAVDVTFFLFREENRLTVPRTALFRVDGNDMVWAVRGGGDGELERVPVVTGMELRTDTIIESGLRAGDFVVTDANNSDLSEGARVVNER